MGGVGGQLCYYRRDEEGESGNVPAHQSPAMPLLPISLQPFQCFSTHLLDSWHVWLSLLAGSPRAAPFPARALASSPLMNKHQERDLCCPWQPALARPPGLLSSCGWACFSTVLQALALLILLAVISCDKDAKPG